MTSRKRKPQQNRNPRSNSEPTEGQLRHYQERKRELGITDSQQELASYEPPKKKSYSPTDRVTNAMKSVTFEPVVRVSPISISDAPSTIKPSKKTIKDKQIHDYMKRTSSPYEELGSDELPFLYHNDKELPPVDLLLEKDGRTHVIASKPYHQTTDSPELVKETPDFGGARRHIKRKTRKTKQKGKGIGNSKPIKPPTPTPPTKTRKSVQFSPSTKSPSSPKQNKTKTMFISKNKNKSKAVVQYVNRQREQDLRDLMLGKIPLEGGNKRKTRKSKKSNKNLRKTRKKRKRTRRRTYKKRGGGARQSRGQRQNENNPQVAVPMREDLPLPLGAQRIPTISYPSAQSSATISATTNVDPASYRYVSSSQEGIPDAREVSGPQISDTIAHSLIEMFPQLSEAVENYPSEEIEGTKLFKALKNYRYNVKYFDCFNANNSGNYKKRNSKTELERQLFHLITCWQKYGSDDINELINGLESPSHEEIRY